MDKKKASECHLRDGSLSFRHHKWHICTQLLLVEDKTYHVLKYRGWVSRAFTAPVRALIRVPTGRCGGSSARDGQIVFLFRAELCES